MNAVVRQPWFFRALLVGGIYTAIGVVFAAPTSHARMWRLGAWLASAAVYATHITYEEIRMRCSLWATAWHVAVAASAGGFGLAVAATVHSLFVPPTYHRSRFLLALVVWPFVTGLPAFLLAIPAAALLAFFFRKRSASSTE